MTMLDDPPRPILGEAGATCRACGTQLAEDQRYCLACGERRAETRLPFLEILARQRGDAPAQAVTTEQSRRVSRPAGVVDRLNANTAAIAGIGCLLLAIALGYLVGHSGNDEPQRAAQQPVIINGGAGAAAAPATTAAAATPADPAATTATTDDGSTKSGDSAAEKNDSAPSASASKATNKALKELETSGGDYSKKSAKLPKTLGTGGKPPPKDNKPAAGGGAFEEIK